MELGKDINKDEERKCVEKKHPHRKEVKRDQKIFVK
jgi:hypothetical protein